jgi:ribonuclease T2
MIKRGIVVGLLIVAVVAGAAAKHHHHQSSSGSSGAFDYYLLSLSWAPSYCHEHPSDHSNECRAGGRQGFVLHGLWPQSEGGAPPMECGATSPVEASLVDSLLQYFPSRGLIQHEWQEHGSCSGLSAQDYFHQAVQAYKNVQTPEQFRDVSREMQVGVGDLETRFAQANHAPAGAVRVSCHDGELVNLEMCLSKDLQYRACSASVRECPAGNVSMLPPQ